MRIFLANLGKYNEGQLVGQWLDLPCTNEKLMTALQEIGIDWVQYEEYFITEYEFMSKDSNIRLEIGEYESLSMLNEVAKLIEKLEDHELQVLKAIIEAKSPDVSDLQDIIGRLAEYTLCTDVHTEEDLGRYIIGNRGYTIDTHLAEYLNYEELGRDEAINSGGDFTSLGWLEYA